MAELRVLVTGANGFIGGAFIDHCLAATNWEILGTVRRVDAQLPEGVKATVVRDLNDLTTWKRVLGRIDTVVHTAARVHRMKDSSADPAAEFHAVNVEGTLTLGRAAAEAGVKRLIFLSSIKVNGDETLPGRPFRASDPGAATDSYGRSKLEAELGLQELSRQTGMEVVIIRPVLVYGPGVRANFLTMMRWLSRRLPLPLGGIVNARSLIGIDNLVDVMATCVRHPSAKNATFLVSDGEDLSTPALLRRLAAALGQRALLVPVPPAILTGALRLVGRSELSVRLCGSLQVDVSDTRRILNWHPPMSVDEGLAKTAKFFLQDKHRKARW